MSDFRVSCRRQRCDRSGSLVVPRALLDLAGRPVILEGFRPHRRLSCASCDVRSSPGLRGLRSPSELHLFAPVGKPTSSPGIGPVRVTWPASLPATCSSVPFRPSIDMLSGVHSRNDVTTASSGSSLPGSYRVPTSWFRTTSPVCSANRPVTGTAAFPLLRARALRVAGLLHPAANRGVHRVFGWLSLLPEPPFPAMLSYPSKDSPHPQPYRVTTACALLPFSRSAARTSRGRVAASTVQSASRFEHRLQGFALWMGPYHRAPFPTSDGLPSRGLLFPLQGPSISIGACAVDRDEQPGRLRGPVAAPSEHIPVGSSAAPFRSP